MPDSALGGKTVAGTQPDHAPFVLAALILVASVANLNLSVANVALPEIGKALDTTQTQLDMVAVGFSLGLAASVLWLGALGDRYGRRSMLVGGMALSIPAGIVAAWAPSVAVLIGARIAGGFAAGMAFPTTLALITALWSGPKRTRSIALWSAIGGGMAALGPLVAGALLEIAWWGSVFLVTLPLACLAIVMALILIPSHVNETTNPVDNLGGILSMLLVASLVLAINFAPTKNSTTIVVVGVGIALVSGVAFVMRQRTAKFPLYDLKIAGRRLFWVAALAGCIVFGSLMGALFIGQQFLQNVLAYEPLASGAAILPAAVFMVIAAPMSAKLIASIGSRLTLMMGYVFCFLGLFTMLLLWGDGSAYWQVALAYIFVGTGVGLAGTPASNTLTGSVPVSRAGMASGTADLQRDLGGAIMQSVLGAFLALGYASALSKQIAASPEASKSVPEATQVELESSYSATAIAAEKYPQYSDQILAAARESFVEGQRWAYAAGIAAILLGAAVVFKFFPNHQRETELLEEYHSIDSADAMSEE